MSLLFQASTNTREVAALMALGVELLTPEELGGGDPVERFFTEAKPYNPREPGGGGELQWMLGTNGFSVSTGDLREAWANPEKADSELDAFVDTLDDDIRAILRRLIPRATIAAINAGMHNWTDLSTAAKKARRKLAFRHGKRTVVIDADYTEGVARKFSLPYPPPRTK